MIAIPTLFEKNETPQFRDFKENIVGASITFFYFIDFNSQTPFSIDKIRPFLKPEGFVFPDRIDSAIFDDHYLKKVIRFRGELQPKSFEYQSEQGYLLQTQLRFYLTIYNSMVSCLQVVLPIHFTTAKASKPLDIDTLLDILNINNMNSPAIFKLDGQKTNFFDSCHQIGDQLAQSLGADMKEVKHYEYDYNCVWLFDADESCQSGDEFAKKYAFACSGILATDKDWRKQNTSEVLENINSDVGAANHYISISERVLLSVASRWDLESSREKFKQYHCDPALTRAQEYGYYHRILLEKANSRIPRVEEILKIIRSGEVNEGRLQHILELRLRMVRDLNERWNPYIFERGQETRILKLYFEMHGINEEYQLANERLQNIGEILQEFYQLGQNKHLREHEEQLIQLQKTNLISQLQIEEITHLSQQNRNAVSLIGFIVLISFLLEVVVNGLRFIKETQLEAFIQKIEQVPLLGENVFLNFASLCLIGVGITYLFYVIFGKIRNVKQQLRQNRIRSNIERKAEFYDLNDDLRKLIRTGKIEEAVKYLQNIKENLQQYEDISKKLNSLKKEHHISL